MTEYTISIKNEFNMSHMNIFVRKDYFDCNEEKA